ncbi:uncharacterized protein N0V89_012451 [Didymosphaeria variabile]|uniref:F-box domain-containing protein n=1 Tax=Didymosphaeria variabile TaxID=1932322 RepID=A0A9W8XAJ4_9PLEO|nr:uncharacterized protein N0V89_012451 [Didymosphaeria variabile]KAJ4344707.1 hypothetical protein N0V89_012451 [Didymosphaeria variabile]
MPRHIAHDSDDEEPLDDKTAALQLRSKRTERQKKQRVKRDRKRDAIISLTKLPTELIIESLTYLQPGDVLNFSHTNRRFRSLVDANSNVIGNAIIQQRYTLLAQCLVLPKLLTEIDASARPLLVDERRQEFLGIHRKPYQHLQPPDQHFVCTCLSCILAWNNLCVALDFAHWQTHLDTGEPLPMIPRGTTPEWNRELVRRNAQVVRTALQNPLWHARILEMHLDSTIQAIRRQSKNKGNKRKHVEMTDEDAARGTDAFLSKPGPLSLEFPYHRDNYHLLEAYLPNRYWKKSEERWIYGTAVHHERDLAYVLRGVLPAGSKPLGTVA